MLLCVLVLLWRCQLAAGGPFASRCLLHCSCPQVVEACTRRHVCELCRASGKQGEHRAVCPRIPVCFASFFAIFQGWGCVGRLHVHVPCHVTFWAGSLRCRVRKKVAATSGHQAVVAAFFSWLLACWGTLPGICCFAVWGMSLHSTAWHGTAAVS